MNTIYEYILLQMIIICASYGFRIDGKRKIYINKGPIGSDVYAPFVGLCKIDETEDCYILEYEHNVFGPLMLSWNNLHTKITECN